MPSVSDSSHDECECDGPQWIHWAIVDGRPILGLQCPSGQEQKKPWRIAKQTFVSHLGQDARDDVEEDKALKKRLQALRESQRLGEGTMHVLRVQGLQAFGMATNKMGYERAAYLALAVTAVLNGWKPRGADMCKLKLQVERAMSSGLGAASAASSSVGEERCVRRPVRKGHTKKKQKKSAAAQRKHSTPVLLRSLAAMCKRRPRPPFHALSDDVQPKAMPSKPSKEVSIGIPVKAMPSLPPATALGAASAKAAPPLGPPPKAMPKVKEKSEIKEELLEIKAELVESSEEDEASEEDEVMEPEEQPNYQSVGAPTGQTPRGPEFLRLAQQNRDWDPASPKFDHCTWAHCIQRIDVEQLHFAHASISMTFRNGRCKGEPVQTLTNKLLSGETQVEDIPALVGVQDLHGKVFIVSGNRRLFALKAFADQLPKGPKGEGVQCVKASTLLVSLSDMHLFPQSLFARCVEAFTSHDGGLPTLRPAVVQPGHTQAQSVFRPAVVLKAAPPVPRGTILRSWAVKGLEGHWIDHRGSLYMVKDRDGVGMEVVRNNGKDVRYYRLYWDGQTFVWPSHQTNHVADCVNADTINWRCGCAGQISFTWHRVNQQ